MVSDQSHKHQEDEKKVLEGDTEPGKQPLPFLPFAVQLQNIFAIEISAKRFPVDISSPPNTQLNLSVENVQIDVEHQMAQVILNVQVKCIDDPPPFEILFNLLGLFKYDQAYKIEQIRTYLEQGSLSVMIPFARELLLSLCTRLQIPLLLLPLVQLAPPQSETNKENTPG